MTRSRLVHHIAALFLAIGALTPGCRKSPGEAPSQSSLTQSSSPCWPKGSIPGPGAVPTKDMLIEHAKITKQEIQAINTYTATTVAASTVQGVLQCKSREDLGDWCFLGPAFLKLAVDFESGVKKISRAMPYVGTVYRGILVKPEILTRIKASVGTTTGLGYDGKVAYVSSTRRLAYAKEWISLLEKERRSSTFGKFDQRKVIFVIHQCHGASIESIEPEPRGSAQQEVILPPSPYVLASQREESGILYITAYERSCGRGGTP